MSLGSNSGPRGRHLAWALRELGRLRLTRLRRVSRLLETSPVGVRGQRPYLNCCAALETALSPMGLLIALKTLEARRGRRPGARWGPRPLDIDILYYGNKRVRTPWLEVPHPRALRRRFVLEGLAQLRPWRPLPRARGRTARAALAALKAPSQNVTFAGRAH